jgi:hypothetical protein
MQIIDAVIEAETQLDWGRDPKQVELALGHLREVWPESVMIRPLQMKLVQLRLAEVLTRFALRR